MRLKSMGSQRVGHSLMTKQQQQPHVVRELFGFLSVGNKSESLLLLLLLLSRFSPTVRPHRQQPTRLRHPWDSPGKNTGVGCHCLLQCMKVKSESEVAQSCPTLCNPMDCSPPGSSVRGIFQARVQEWGATAFSESLLVGPKDPSTSRRAAFPMERADLEFWALGRQSFLLRFEGQCSWSHYITFSDTHSVAADACSPLTGASVLK